MRAHPLRHSVAASRVAGIALSLVLMICAGPTRAAAPGEPAMSAPPADAPLDPAALRTATARFAPVDVVVDLEPLPESERYALARLVEASRIVDALYLRQVAPGNDAWLQTLAADRSPLGIARLDYFLINKGPWSRLDGNRPFLPGVGAKPGEAAFYPAGATREELERWFASLPDAQRADATGFYTTVRRAPGGGFVAVPYSLEYQGDLARAAALLREAAAATKQASLKRFLELRAKAFLDNDYYASDVAWMQLDATIEPTIGPYEVYEDDWFNYKAAFESFVTVVDAGESAKLARFSRELQSLEDRLPIDPTYRRAKLGGLAPISVVNVLYAAGDGNHDIQTAAYNLPNDERVVAQMGSKRVLLRNFQQAKFEQVLVPTAARTLAPADRALVAFEPFFTHILMHELMHGLGPQTIRVRGRESTVRQELKETNGALEEAKADIAGLWALQQLVDRGVLPKAQERAYYVTFLASAFRTLRFGLNEAHAKGMALQLNWLLDRRAVRIAADGTCALDFARVRAAVAGLTGEIMTVQATGDYAKARAWLARDAVIRPEVRRALDGLADVPVDVRPRFVTAEQLVADSYGHR